MALGRMDLGPIVRLELGLWTVMDLGTVVWLELGVGPWLGPWTRLGAFIWLA